MKRAKKYFDQRTIDSARMLGCSPNTLFDVVDGNAHTWTLIPWGDKTALIMVMLGGRKRSVGPDGVNVYPAGGRAEIIIFNDPQLGHNPRWFASRHSWGEVYGMYRELIEAGSIPAEGPVGWNEWPNGGPVQPA